MLKAFKSSLSANKKEEFDHLGIKLEEEIGVGTYSKVYRGYWKSPSKERLKCAIKIIDEKTAPPDFISYFLPREIEISKSIQHKNLLTTLSHFSHQNKTYIVTEMARFDVLQYLRIKGALRESLARRLFYELSCGIQSMHDSNLVHRDIKCENLLITIDGVLKVADFGFARHFTTSDTSQTYCGSTAYTAPEVLYAKEPYNAFYSDTWSCGVILFILLTGTMPFNKNNLYTIIKSKDVDVVFPLPYSTRLSSVATKLVRDILVFNPESRTKLSEIVAQNHPWYTMNIQARSSLGRRRSSSNKDSISAPSRSSH